jgi:hypothetical protein
VDGRARNKARGQEAIMTDIDHILLIHPILLTHHQAKGMTMKPMTDLTALFLSKKI